MNSFGFVLSGKLFICPMILSDSFAGQSNLGCRSLLFTPLNISCQSLLTCKVIFEKSADRLMGTLLQVTNYFSLAAFKILSLYLNLSILIMMCLGVGLFASILFGTLCVSWTCMSISLTKLRKFSFIIFPNRFPISCFFSSPSGTPKMQTLDLLKFSWRLLILPSLFWIHFSYRDWFVCLFVFAFLCSISLIGFSASSTLLLFPCKLFFFQLVYPLFLTGYFIYC